MSGPRPQLTAEYRVAYRRAGSSTTRHLDPIAGNRPTAALLARQIADLPPTTQGPVVHVQLESRLTTAWTTDSVIVTDIDDLPPETARPSVNPDQKEPPPCQTP